MIEPLARDVRHAARSILRYRGLSLVAGCCMALGIGVCSGLFVAVNPWLYRPLPYPEPDRLAGQLYVPYRREPWATVSIVLRARSDPSGLAGPLRAVLRDVDPRIPPSAVFALEEVRARACWVSRLWGRMLGQVAALALVLAALGVYGVVSHMVSRRTNEIRHPHGGGGRPRRGAVVGRPAGGGARAPGRGGGSRGHLHSHASPRRAALWRRSRRSPDLRHLLGPAGGRGLRGQLRPRSACHPGRPGGGAARRVTGSLAGRLTIASTESRRSRPHSPPRRAACDLGGPGAKARRLDTSGLLRAVVGRGKGLHDHWPEWRARLRFEVEAVRLNSGRPELHRSHRAGSTASEFSRVR